MKNLCIFLVSGKTFSFKNVEIISDNETHVSFTYKAMSDDLPKKASFSKAHVAGISTHDSALPPIARAD